MMKAFFLDSGIFNDEGYFLGVFLKKPIHVLNVYSAQNHVLALALVV